jgi:hypothetical protein
MVRLVKKKIRKREHKLFSHRSTVNIVKNLSYLCDLRLKRRGIFFFFFKQTFVLPLFLPSGGGCVVISVGSGFGSRSATDKYGSEYFKMFCIRVCNTVKI